MTNTNTVNFTKNISGYLEQAVLRHEIINVNTSHGNAILLDEAKYNSLVETAYLLGIPGMKERLSDGLSTPIEDCDEFEW